MAENTAVDVLQSFSKKDKTMQLPDDSGVLMSRARCAVISESESTSETALPKAKPVRSCGKPSFDGTPFVCDSCGAIRNCCGDQSKSESFVSQSTTSDDEFTQNITKADFDHQDQRKLINCLNVMANYIKVEDHKSSQTDLSAVERHKIEEKHQGMSFLTFSLNSN